VSANHAHAVSDPELKTLAPRGPRDARALAVASGHHPALGVDSRGTIDGRVVYGFRAAPAGQSALIGHRTRDQAVISVVIPFTRDGQLVAAARGTRRRGNAEALDLEIIFVDDGSKDGSWKVVKELSRLYPNVQPGVRFRRNFGKAAALSAGFRRRRRATTIMTLDADLQDDPAEIPRFLAAMAKGTNSEPVETLTCGRRPARRYDVVSGWKRVRLDPWSQGRAEPYLQFDGQLLTGTWLHDHNCGMKCYRAEVFKEVRLYGELHRFIPVLAAARGYRAARSRSIIARAASAYSNTGCVAL